MTTCGTPRGDHPSLGTSLDPTSTLRVSKLRLVFGPAETVPELLRSVAEALDPLDLVPVTFDCSASREGYRLRVTCELDPEQPDLGRVLSRLLRRRSCAPRAGEAFSPRPRSAA